MQAAAAYSHRSDKVSDCVPLAPTTANAVRRDTLSHAATLVCCVMLLLAPDV